MVIDISIAIIALAFVFLVIYLASTLKSLKLTLDQARVNLIKINEIADEIQHKADSFNGFFDAASLVGDRVRNKVETLSEQKVQPRQSFGSCETDERLKHDNISDILEWLSGGIRLWNALKKRR